jgi:carbohydrate kinase (thermoresistant glucokinase family)
VIVVVMGVAGAGKTTVGRLVASELGLPFHDADDFHPQRNREKMAAGIALSQRDRRPWLSELGRNVAVWETEGGAVLACSALRRQHREILGSAAPGQVAFVFLDADPEVIRARLATRTGHYMPVSLLDSQLEALEPPRPGDAVIVCPDDTPIEIARSIVERLRSGG